MNWRRALAKVVYLLSGWASSVKTPQKTFIWDSVTDEFSPTGRHWLPCRLSTWLLDRSLHLDWDHWDHWACVHDSCGGTRCEECGGVDCVTGGDDFQLDGKPL